MTSSTHIPIRTCVCCGEKKPKHELLRIVRNLDGSISVDRTGKSLGRGAYLCPNPDCVIAAQKKRKLDKSFRQNVPDSIYEQIQKSNLMKSKA